MITDVLLTVPPTRCLHCGTSAAEPAFWAPGYARAFTVCAACMELPRVAKWVDELARPYGRCGEAIP